MNASVLFQGRRVAWASSVVLAAVLAACGGGGDSAPAEAPAPAAATPTTPPAAPDPTPSAPRDVEIRFAATAGGAPVKCGTPVTGLGLTGATAQVKDFRFYVSNVVLVTRDQREVPLALAANDDWNLTAGEHRVTLIDLEDQTGDCANGTPGTNAVIKGQVPAGDYQGVRFTLGVPFALNHTLYSDPATAKPPIDLQAMAWSWQSGRKFAKIELTQPADAATPWAARTFNFHLGSTGCTGNPANGETVACQAPNRVEVRFDAFDPATQQVALDLRTLLAGEDITVNAAGASGCMSGGTDPECDTLFQALALDWKADGTGTGLMLGGGRRQTVFKVVAR